MRKSPYSMLLSGLATIMLSTGFLPVSRQVSLAGVAIGAYDRIPERLGDFVQEVKGSGWSGADRLTIPAVPQSAVLGQAVAPHNNQAGQRLDPLIQAVLKSDQAGNVPPYLALPLGLTAKEEPVPSEFIGVRSTQNEPVAFRRQIHVLGAGQHVLLWKLERKVMTCYLTDPAGNWQRAVTGTSESNMHVIPLNEETQKDFQTEKDFWFKLLPQIDPKAAQGRDTAQ